MTQDDVTGPPRAPGGKRVALPADEFGDKFGDAFGLALVNQNLGALLAIASTSAMNKTVTAIKKRVADCPVRSALKTHMQRIFKRPGPGKELPGESGIDQEGEVGEEQEQEPGNEVGEEEEEGCE